MKKGLWGLFGLICALALYHVLVPNIVQPQAWHAPKAPAAKGVLAPNEQLQQLIRIQLPNGEIGAESLAIDAQGNILMPTASGLLLRSHVDDLPNSTFTVEADTQGRPLGIEFDKAGNLLMADAILGLTQYSKDKRLSTLAGKHAPVDFGFVDDLAIAQDGTIYFSDATHIAWLRDKPDMALYAAQYEIIEHGGRGRLFAYSPSSGSVTELMSGLTFANGVALSKDEDFVLVNETGAYRVLRYWLKGENAGKSDVFADNLPGFPDNITTAPDGGFWVALPNPRSGLVDKLSNWPRLRGLLARIPPQYAPRGKPKTHIIKLDENGNIIQSLQDSSAKLPHNTSVIEYADKLYLGSLNTPYIGIYPLQSSSPL